MKNVGRYVRITEEEAHEAWGEDISPFWERRANAYVAGSVVVAFQENLHSADDL